MKNLIGANKKYVIKKYKPILLYLKKYYQAGSA